MAKAVLTDITSNSALRQRISLAIEKLIDALDRLEPEEEIDELALIEGDPSENELDESEPPRAI